MKTGLHSQYLWLAVGVAVALLVHSPALALLAGFGCTFLTRGPLHVGLSHAAKWLLQISVILLGYGLTLSTVASVGRESFWITAMSISMTLGLGWLVGRAFRLEKSLALLLSGGTAICGGSAIAALAPAIGAPLGQVGIALTVVFLLNGVALLLFPLIGHMLGMSQVTFGLWSALAIHDTSSVVGAGAAFGAVALAVGTTVKLTRAMWIVPVAALSSRLHRQKGPRSKWHAAVPWFLFGFLAAAATRSFAPQYGWLWDALVNEGRTLMLVSLFLIGLGLHWGKLRRTGVRPLLAGVVLWLTVSVVTLTCVQTGLWHITWK